MRVDAYRVTPVGGAEVFGNALLAAHGSKQNDHLSLFGMRIEKLIQSPDKKDIYLDLVKILKQDIGIIGEQTPVKPIPKKQDEDFSTNTAAIFDTESGILFMQFNINGVRSGIFRQYTSAFCNCEGGKYLFSHITKDPQASSTIKNKKIDKIKINANLILLEDNNISAPGPIGQLFSALANDGDAGKIIIEISCTRGSSKDPAKHLSHEMVDDILQFNDDAMSVDKRCVKINYYDLYANDITDRVVSLQRLNWYYQEDLKPEVGQEERYPFKNRLDIIKKSTTKLPKIKD